VKLRDHRGFVRLDHDLSAWRRQSERWLVKALLGGKMSLGKWQWLANNLSKCFKSAGFTAKKQHHVGHVVC